VARVEDLANLTRVTPSRDRYLTAVSRRTNPKKLASLRSWRVSIMRSRGEYLGSVEAPDRERAEAAAIKQLPWPGPARRRLLIRERL
jgi:hypothetical protein